MLLQCMQVEAILPMPFSWWIWMFPFDCDAKKSSSQQRKTNKINGSWHSVQWLYKYRRPRVSPSLYVGLVCIRIYIYTHMSFTFICMDVLRIARYRNMLLCDGCDDSWHMYMYCQTNQTHRSAWGWLVLHGLCRWFCRCHCWIWIWIWIWNLDAIIFLFNIYILVLYFITHLANSKSK